MTILSETTHRVLTPTGVVLLVIAAILMVITFIIASDINLVIGITFLIAIVMCFGVAMTIGSKPHREIKVIISDDYPATNLYDEYTVEDRDGKIWILTEKEPMTEE